MSIKTVKISNFKLVKDLEQDFNGKNIMIVGENGIGKSSVLQAIQIALGGKNIPPLPISHGEDDAYVEVLTGIDGKDYTFKAKFQPHQSPKLEVTAPDGIRDDKKGVIRNLVGGDDFDIDQFVEWSKTSEGRKKQVEVFKSYFEPEIIEQLDRLKQKITNHEQERTETGREVKTLKGFIEEAGISSGDFVKYAEKKDLTELTEKINKISENNEKLTLARERSGDRKNRLQVIDEEMARLQKEAADLESKEEAYAKWAAENPAVDITDLNSELEEARVFNSRCETISHYETKQKELKDAQESYGESTALIESSREALDNAIKDMGGPIPGLEFDLDQLYYNGNPVDINTLSTSEIMYLGVELKMAANPNVKVLFLEKGESLGQKRLQDIIDMANERGYQIIMEEVERGTEEMTFRFITE